MNHQKTDLETTIDPWLQHMSWRKDFAKWREQRINQEYYQEERLALLERVVGPLAGQQMLDLGAGMGGFAVAAALRGARVVACEYNRAYCEIIALRAERHGLSLPVSHAAGEHVPFPTAHFDVLVCWDVIEHVQSPQQMLSEIARVLKPDGYALLTVVNRWAWNDPHYHIRGINWLPRSLAEWIITYRGRSKEGRAFRDMQRLSDMHYYDYYEFVALAKRHGFRVCDIREELLIGRIFNSRQKSRRVIRSLLRVVELERAAYVFQRRWYTSMFELALWKQS